MTARFAQPNVSYGASATKARRSPPGPKAAARHGGNYHIDRRVVASLIPISLSLSLGDQSSTRLASVARFVMNPRPVLGVCGGEARKYSGWFGRPYTSAPVRPVFDLLPVARPFLAPGKRPLKGDADFRRQIGLSMRHRCDLVYSVCRAARYLSLAQPDRRPSGASPSFAYRRATFCQSATPPGSPASASSATLAAMDAVPPPPWCRSTHSAIAHNS